MNKPTENFGICGHGNVGLLDPLYEVRDKVCLVSPIFGAKHVR